MDDASIISPITKSSALDLLELMRTKAEAYRSVNDQLRDLQGDHHSSVQPIDQDLETGLIKLIDQILDAEVAEYFLYEVPRMKGGGLIRDEGVDWPIQTIHNLRSYVLRTRSSE